MLKKNANELDKELEATIYGLQNENCIVYGVVAFYIMMTCGYFVLPLRVLQRKLEFPS